MTRPTKYARWTNHKLARLRECYPVMTRAQLEQEFAPHPISSIIWAARGMKLSKQRRDWKAVAAAHVPVFAFGRVGQ